MILRGGWGKALSCPSWVNTQVAELYGVWMLVEDAICRVIPQVVMLQDNMQAIWATLNLNLGPTIGGTTESLRPSFCTSVTQGLSSILPEHFRCLLLQ